MSWRGKVWWVVLVLCFFVAVWNVRDVVKLWRIHRTSVSVKGQTWDGPESWKRQVAHLKSIDKEAGEILDFQIKNSYSDWYGIVCSGIYDDLNSVAGRVVYYPDNSFFACMLVQLLEREYAINPDLRLQLIERLINDDSDNAYYRYLKSLAILDAGTGEFFGRAMEEIELGNECERFGFSYELYADRVERLLEKAHFMPLSKGGIRTREYDTLSRLEKRLREIIRAQGSEYSYDQSYVLEVMLSRAGEWIMNGAVTTYDALRGARLSVPGKKVKFLHDNLPEDEIEEARQEYTQVLAKWDRLKELSYASVNKIWYFGIGVFVCSILVATLLILGAVWLFFLLSGWVFGLSETRRVGFLRHVLLILSLIYFLIPGPFITPDIWEYDEDGTYYGEVWVEYAGLVGAIVCVLVWAFISLMGHVRRFEKGELSRHWVGKGIVCIVLGLLGYLGKWVVAAFIGYNTSEIYFYWTATCILLFTLLMFGWPFIRRINFAWVNRNHLFQLLLWNTFVACLNSVFFRQGYIVHIARFLCVSGSILIISYESSSKWPCGLKAVSGLFSKSEEFCSLRSRSVCLVRPYLVFFAFLILGVGFYLKTGIKEIESLEARSLAEIEKWPGDYSEAYDAILSKCGLDDGDFVGNDGITLYSIKKFIPVLKPEDLSKVLALLKGSDVYSYDQHLIELFEYCRKDVHGIIIDELENPNEESVVISRALAGDESVKSELEEYVQDIMSGKGMRGRYGQIPAKQQSYGYGLGYFDNIAGAISMVYEPEEARDRLIQFINGAETEVSNSYFPYSRGANIRLPDQQGNEVLEAYLSRSGYDCLKGFPYSWGEESIRRYCDCEIADNVLKVALAGERKRGEQTVFDGDWHGGNDLGELEWGDWREPLFMVYPFISDDSVGLLREYLDAERDDLRAFVVWQLGRLGYEFSDEEVGRIVHDTSWKVRVNGVFALGRDRLGEFGDDEDAVVRVAVMALEGAGDDG